MAAASVLTHGLIIISLMFLSIFLTNMNVINGAEVLPMQINMMMNESRRKLGGFQMCALCTCCGGAKGLCFPSPCCYAIKCNLPNKPFGFCSLAPITCNCFGCHL